MAPEGAGLEDARKVGSVFAYGNFLTVVVNFAIIAFALFIARQVHQQDEAAAGGGCRGGTEVRGRSRRRQTADRDPRSTRRLAGNDLDSPRRSDAIAPGDGIHLNY